MSVSVVYDADALGRAAQHLGLRLVVVFGSRNDGQPTRDSDLDLALLAGRRRVSVLDALRELTPVFPTSDLDVILLNTADPLLRYEALVRGRRLWGDPDAFADEHARAYRMAADDAPMQRFEATLLRRKTAALLARAAP